jgi:hypothetical protein
MTAKDAGKFVPTLPASDVRNMLLSIFCLKDEDELPDPVLLKLGIWEFLRATGIEEDLVCVSIMAMLSELVERVVSSSSNAPEILALADQKFVTFSGLGNQWYATSSGQWISQLPEAVVMMISCDVKALHARQKKMQELAGKS